MKNFTVNQRMSIQEIGQRIEKAISLSEKDFYNSIENCQLAFDGHPLWKIIHMCMINSELNMDYLRKISIEMKNWKSE
jgi:hypothetical protein